MQDVPLGEAEGMSAWNTKDDTEGFALSSAMKTFVQNNLDDDILQGDKTSHWSC